MQCQRWARPRLSVSAASCTLTSPPAIQGPWSSDGKIILLLSAITISPYHFRKTITFHFSELFCSCMIPKMDFYGLIFHTQRQHYYVEYQSKLGNCLDPVLATCYNTTQAEIIKIGQRGSAWTLQYWGRLTNMINTSSYSQLGPNLAWTLLTDSSWVGITNSGIDKLHL